MIARCQLLLAMHIPVCSSNNIHCHPPWEQFYAIYIDSSVSSKGALRYHHHHHHSTGRGQELPATNMAVWSFPLGSGSSLFLGQFPVPRCLRLAPVEGRCARCCLWTFWTMFGGWTRGRWGMRGLYTGSGCVFCTEVTLDMPRPILYYREHNLISKSYWSEEVH